ncbi:AI-2E family transporter [uncultured Lamprocystis sp.]|uniref:AI-2E family transporter n=1 Tax=uncultured Lamprocystis sp. TaxID=543132 RepID=UPI00341ACF41
MASLATAFFIWIWLWYLGLDFAMLWALLAFLLNFVPFVGSILMAVPAILLALVQTDLQTTLLVALGYLVVNTAIGSILEPRFMGRGLDASPLTRPIAILLGPDLEPDAQPASDDDSAGAQTPAEQTQELLAQERQDTQQGQ